MIFVSLVPRGSWLPYSTYLYLDFHLFHDQAKRKQQGDLLAPGSPRRSITSQIIIFQSKLKKTGDKNHFRKGQYFSVFFSEHTWPMIALRSDNNCLALIESIIYQGVSAPSKRALLPPSQQDPWPVGHSSRDLYSSLYQYIHTDKILQISRFYKKPVFYLQKMMNFMKMRTFYKKKYGNYLRSQ